MSPTATIATTSSTTAATAPTIITTESLEETSATYHEPILLTECPPLPVIIETASMKDRRHIADMANRAYRRASAKSNVLSRSKAADIALLSIDELSIGQWLGKGSFSDVHEISKIQLKDSGDGTAATTATASTSTASLRQNEEGTRVARNILATNYLRTDEEHNTHSSRYAIKFLKKELRQNPKKYAVGTTDLVVEGLFLASLTHPNIIKVRGLPEGEVHSMVNQSSGDETEHHGDGGSSLNSPMGYFLILDRLYDTLSERIYKCWVKEHADAFVKRDKVLDRLFKSRMNMEMNSTLAVRVKVAFDIAAALKYLHEKNIIYRDLKPENLGFDVRGDIKLFDLGLVKELHPEARDPNGNWKMSMAGTPRYMSPECGLYKPYNLSADVYSFSMLLWEIISLRQPLKGFNYSQLKKEVFHQEYRPPLKKVWHRGLRSLISVGWHHNPSKRPSMDEIYDKLRTLYTVLAPGCVSEEEISHNRRRSTYISARLSRISFKHLMTLESKESVKDESIAA